MQKAMQTAMQKSSDQTSILTEIEDGEIMEETDYGHSSSVKQTTPEKEQQCSTLVAALLPPDEKQTVEPTNQPTEVDKADSSSETTTGSNEKQTAEPANEPTEVDKTDGSKNLGSQGEQPTEQTSEHHIEDTSSNTDKPEPRGSRDRNIFRTIKPWQRSSKTKKTDIGWKRGKDANSS